MKSTPFALLLSLLLFACHHDKNHHSLGQVASPDGGLVVQLVLDGNNQLAYRTLYHDEVVLDTSRLGFVFQNQTEWGQGLTLTTTSTQNGTEDYETVWGENRRVQEGWQEAAFTLVEEQAPNREVTLRVRVFDDGFGFRYEFADQEGADEVVIMDERTQFALTGDHTAWWIPADYDSYEYLYNETPVSQIDTANAQNFSLAAQSMEHRHAAATPLTMRTSSGVHLSIHEANLTRYAGMTLRVLDDKRTLQSVLTPAADGSRVTTALPFQTPWRTVQVSPTAAGLVESNLMTNLNEPHALEDVSWIQPAKYMGIWWSHHMGKTSWAPGPNAGATTAEAKRYIDFASAHGFPLLLIEGWNQGWDTWGAWPRDEDNFNFTQDAPGFNLREVVAYGNEKGVGLVAHHETGSSVLNYENQLEDAFDLLQELGIHAVKTGYVGPIIPEGEHHHGQWMVEHYRRVLEVAAAHEVMVVAHEPIKPTGLRRTYPNMMAREGVRGSEFNAPWGGGNPPEHLTIVPFTRMLAGPIDYTPGLVRLSYPEGPQGLTLRQVPTTVGYQLAEYVVVYSPVQMASDLPEHYEGEAALDFIKAVPTDWEWSRVLQGEIGDFIVVARQERGGEDWFLGGLTNAEARTLSVPLTFLAQDQHYQAHIYADGEAGEWPALTPYRVSHDSVVASDTLTLPLVSAGGVAIHFEAIEE